MRITDISQCEEGLPVIIHVNDNTKIKAKLSIENKQVYCCQNAINGYECKNKHGYRYSCLVDLDHNAVYAIDEPIKAKPSKSKPQHLGYKWDGVVYTKDSIDDFTIEECKVRKNIIEEKLKCMRKELRRWESLNKKGWK